MLGSIVQLTNPLYRYTQRCSFMCCGRTLGLGVHGGGCLRKGSLLHELGYTASMVVKM